MRRAALDERAIAGYSWPLPDCTAGSGAGCCWPIWMLLGIGADLTGDRVARAYLDSVKSRAAGLRAIEAMFRSSLSQRVMAAYGAFEPSRRGSTVAC
jgi:hypothetical protein